MGSPVEVREWQLHGLPADSVSTNSAILVTRGRRWPLMIDPQMQANKWIKQTNQKRGIVCTKMSDVNMLRSLEQAIRLGKHFLLEDIGEHIAPSLEPVLARAIFQQNGRTLIRLGDADIDYDSNFRFYMTTKMPNPHYLPEVCIKVTLINFTVTMDGLEEQLLGDTVRKEREDLEKRKNRLLLSMASDKKQLKDLQSKILKLLAESTGDILDDDVLINTLADSKKTANIIADRVSESEKTNAEVNAMRNEYRSVARRGSLLYFVIADLALVDSMYQYSLGYFKVLFKRVLEDSVASDDLQIRLENILQRMNSFIFAQVCRGLFAKDKLLFAFLIASSIQRDSGEMTDAEWNHLLRSNDYESSILKCKEEQLMEALRSYVRVTLGKEFTQTTPPTIEQIYEDTSNVTPCIFVLSQGADPTSILLKFAEKLSRDLTLSRLAKVRDQKPKSL